VELFLIGIKKPLLGLVVNGYGRVRGYDQKRAFMGIKKGWQWILLALPLKMITL